MNNTRRYLSPRIKEALKVSPIVFLNGARQSGKTTLVQNLADQIGSFGKPAAYYSFDRPTEIAAATSAPEAFLTASKGNLIIDEVQLVPELFRALKVVVDELRLNKREEANGKFLLTGSANIMALPSLSDALVGRMAVLTLYPFCTAELIAGRGDGLDRLIRMDFEDLDVNRINLTNAIKIATFPEIVDKTARDREIWFDGYVTTLLQRDVRQIADVEKISIFPNLLRVLTGRVGSLVNESDIARDIGFNSVTAKSYRNILKMMFLNFDLQPWYRNIGKRLVKSPKTYFMDSLLMCYMMGVNIDELEINRPEIFGHVLENFIATEITKLLTFSETKAQLLHFRTSDGKEVDFVLEKQDGSIFAIEIKKAEALTEKDFQGIKELQALAPKEFIGGAVLYSGKTVVPFGKNIWAVPLHILWQ